MVRYSYRFMFSSFASGVAVHLREAEEGGTWVCHHEIHFLYPHRIYVRFNKNLLAPIVCLAL